MPVWIWVMLIRHWRLWKQLPMYLKSMQSERSKCLLPNEAVHPSAHSCVHQLCFGSLESKSADLLLHTFRMSVSSGRKPTQYRPKRSYDSARL